jgi:hypothetical protein
MDMELYKTIQAPFQNFKTSFIPTLSPHITLDPHFCAYLCLQRSHFIHTDVKLKFDFLSLDNTTQNNRSLIEQRNQHSDSTIHRATLHFSEPTNTH